MPIKGILGGAGVKPLGYGLGVETEVKDANFNETTLLLHGDGTDGGQNNTFTDSSSNNASITRLGNTTQGTFSPFSLEDGYWSNFFDADADYLTIASTGYATDFGDITSARRDVDAASSPTRAIFVGGDTPTLVNTIDYVEILTTGDAVDFGDQTTKRDRLSACSNGHGGL